MAETVSSALSSAQERARGLAQQGQALADRVLPPSRRADLWESMRSFAAARPHLASFAAVQLALCGLPVATFAAFGAAVAAFALGVALAVALGALLAALAFVGFALGTVLLFLLLPVLALATGAALTLWFWAWAAYHLFSWWFGEGRAGVGAPGVRRGGEGALGQGEGDWLEMQHRRFEEQQRRARGVDGARNDATPAVHTPDQEDDPKDPNHQGGEAQAVTGQDDASSLPPPLPRQSQNGGGIDGAPRRHPGHRVQQGARTAQLEGPAHDGTDILLDAE